MRVDVLLLLGGFKVFRSQMDQIAVWQNAHIWSPPVATHSASLKTYIAMQRLVMRATLPRVRKNIFLSSDSVRRFSEYFGVAAHNATVAPIGLDDVFLSQPPPPSLAERDPILLAVGEVYAHKRFEITIDALAHLTSRGFSLELWIAGKVIDQRSFKRLTEQIESTGLSGRVRFLGHVNRIHLIELYRSASIFITSTRLETFGLTPLEAMSCGLPVIACAESAVPEVCDSAAVYADASGRSIAESAEALLRNRAEWSNLQARGLRRSRAFSWSAVAERYAEIIEQVIAG